MDEPEKLIDTVLKAVKASGARAVISKGWSNMNGSEDENIFYIGDCPHEWLFQHVAAVVHHGGAGTTACGLINGKPTAIVPFFGEYDHLITLFPMSFSHADLLFEVNHFGVKWSPAPVQDQGLFPINSSLFTILQRRSSFVLH